MSELQAMNVTQVNAPIANHPLTRLVFSSAVERWKYAEYHQMVQAKSETLIGLRDTIERWRTTPYDVLFQEMSA